MSSHKKWYFLVVFLAFAMSAKCDLMVRDDRPGKSKNNVNRENVVLESQDRGAANPEEDRTIYYKIFLDKELAAKTTSGLFFQKKKLSLHLTPGRYLFFAERWYLEESSDNEVPEYKRANNVWQMKPMYIDVLESPDTLKIIFGMDHDQKEFYFKIEGKSDTIPEMIKKYE